jgi:hypothetical protein
MHLQLGEQVTRLVVRLRHRLAGLRRDRCARLAQGVGRPNGDVTGLFVATACGRSGLLMLTSGLQDREGG